MKFNVLVLNCRLILVSKLDLLLAFETNDRKAVNNPVEANIIAEV